MIMLAIPEKITPAPSSSPNRKPPYMDNATAQNLIDLNTRFYAEHAASFSATRSAPWEGWRHVADIAREHFGDTPAELRVFDLACGNLRFERFLAEQLPHTSLHVTAIDNCPALAANMNELARVDYHSADILTALLAEDEYGSDDAIAGSRTPALDTAFPHVSCDLSVCFGFMHHVPGAKLRQAVLSRLIDAVRPGGIVVVSFWQFMNDGRIARKSARSLDLALSQPPFAGFASSSLEEGDHLLGWQADDAAFRYCHHFSTAEIDQLAASASPLAAPIDTFSADGSNHSLNRYLVLQRNA